MKNLILTLCLSIIVLFAAQCSEDPVKPPPLPVEQERDTITVSLEQTTHRSISVRLSKKLQVKSEYVLNRITGNDTLSFVIFPLISADTLIIDDNDGAGLTIDTEYSYFAYRIDSLNMPKDTSNTVTARTLPPTSHDFSWTEYTLGSFPSAELYDVWGTDENNVYAVGGVETDSGFYSIVHWNGTDWKGIAANVGGSSIFGFSESDIWVAGGGVAHFDGLIWNWVDHYSQNNQSFPLDKVLYDNTPYNAIWGTSSENLYFSGGYGKIVHWNGTKASLMETSTEIQLTDIYGVSNNFILTCGAALAPPAVAMIYNGKVWKTIEGVNYNSLIYSVYAVSPFEYYLLGSVRLKNTGKVWDTISGLSGRFNRIRGNLPGDIVTVGWGAALFHYNGIDWYDFSNILNRPNVILWGVFLTDNKIFAVGNEGQTKAYIFIGSRN